MHKHSGKEFFERARKVISEKKDREPYLAYTYGVLNHFALDVSCHGYIEDKINESGISHAEIEVEFDRELMVMDKKNPITQSLVRTYSGYCNIWWFNNTLSRYNLYC